jgi:hypothetical protein
MRETSVKQVASRAPPKHQLTFNGLCGVISQTIGLFITTAVRTSNPTCKLLYQKEKWLNQESLTPGSALPQSLILCKNVGFMTFF